MVLPRKALPVRLCIVVMLTSVACAGRIAPPAAPGPETEPRASWLIRSGAAGGNEQVVCRSDAPAPCVIEASSASRPVNVSVSVYLYDAGTETTYHGAFLSGFIARSDSTGYETSAGYETTVDYKISPRKQPSVIAVFGPVTSAPGNYELRMALLAEVPGNTDPHQFRHAVPVRVMPSGTQRPS